MHVRHVVRQFHPAIGGLEDAVANLAVALRPFGIDSSVVTLDRLFSDPDIVLAATDIFRGIPVTRIPYRGSRRYPLAPQILRHLHDADIVHVHAIDFFFDFLSLTRPFHRRPLVASTHGGFFHTAFASNLKRIYFNSATRLSARGYTRIFGSSENDAAMFGRIAPGPTMAIENGADIEKWQDAASPVLVPTMIFIGRFSVNKDVAALFALLGALRADPAPWRLIVAGIESDLSAADLRRAAEACGVADRVDIVTNASIDTIRTLIGRASYVVSASRYEGFGLSAVEGLSAGLTPILNRIAPFERLVRTTGCGITVDMQDTREAAMALQRTHDAGRTRYGDDRARNIRASHAYGWHGVASRFADAYREVLAGSQ